MMDDRELLIFPLFFSYSFSGRVVRADSTISSSSITMSLLTPHSKVGRVCVLVAPFLLVPSVLGEILSRE